MHRNTLMLQSVTALVNVFGDAYTSLSTSERALLRADAEAVRVELGRTTPYIAARKLSTRIGGAVNLRSYVDCLVAGARVAK